MMNVKVGQFEVTDTDEVISLGEGCTPLVRSQRLGPAIGATHLYFKLEATNPTGSYKDRFAAAAVNDMRRRGLDRCVATSSGNTGSALAAYCARAGIACDIAVVETAPLQKLKQMMLYGATIYRVRGFGLDAAITARVIEAVRERAARPGAMLQISAYACSPAGMVGVEAIAGELTRQQARMEHIFVPAGGGGLTLAIARGFRAKGGTDSPPGPRVHCVQPQGNDTIAGPLRRGEARAREVVCTTAISGLQVPMVLDGDGVISHCRASGGTGHLVSDADVWNAQAALAREEGLFVEPAAAASVAAAVAALRKGEIATEAHICCILTGVGFKDLPSVDRMLGDATCPLVEPDEVLR